MSKLAGAEPDKIQDPGTESRFLTCVAGTQIIEPLPAVSRVCVTRKLGLEAELGLEPR